MELYTLDERSIVGHPDVDDAHREIARLSNDLARLVEAHAGYDEVREVFTEFARVLVEHFDREEAIIADLGDGADVADHLARHQENHQTFRNTVAFALDLFRDNAESREIPDIAFLAPAEYFEELKDMDHQMAALVQKLGRT